MVRIVDTPRLGRRYVPDLDRLLHTCETNYQTLTALLAIGKSAGREGRTRVLELRTVEQDRYTATIILRELGSASHWALPRRHLIVRLYHDVHLAEVLQWNNRRILKGSYPYPNAQMVQRDEKQRVNEFLGEWLGYCQRRQLPVLCVRDTGHTPPTASE